MTIEELIQHRIETEPERQKTIVRKPRKGKVDKIVPAATRKNTGSAGMRVPATYISSYYVPPRIEPYTEYDEHRFKLLNEVYVAARRMYYGKNGQPRPNGSTTFECIWTALANAGLMMRHDKAAVIKLHDILLASPVDYKRRLKSAFNIYFR